VPEADEPGDGGLRIHSRHLPVPTRGERARRGAQIAGVLTRHLGPVLADGAVHRRHHTTGGVVAAARPLRLAFETLGGTFVKFGQLVASSPGLFGTELAEEFRSCLDTGPSVAYAEVAALIEDELGMRVDVAFASLDPVPIGRASIAVVHRARLHDGRDVAVKVLRPGVDRSVAVDLSLMEPLFELLSRLTGAQLAGATLQQLDGLRLQIGEELDLRNEARALHSFGALIEAAGFDALVVPTPVPERSSASVLTMSYLDGVAIDDLERAKELGVDPAPLVDQLIRSFFTFVVRERVFHGDVHAGNLLLLRDGRLGLLDWGIVGRLDERTHRFVLRLLAAVLGDEQAWHDVTAYLVDIYGGQLRDAMRMDDDQLTEFLRSMVEPVLLRPFGEFSLGELIVSAEVRAAEAYGIELRRQGVVGALQRLRLQRRLRRAAVEGGGLMSEFDRANFLLGKQLMYFERYGKLFLADAPILGDRAFVAGLLEEQGERPPDGA
jgi:predicted unusual protein kinase regulating ubiquinone biosynthesis (AarF/ABC1/UbiB family)